MAERSNLNNFINISNKIHNNKYNYSKVIYKNNRSKIIIICPIHGEFEQLPVNHSRGHGCSKCGAKIVGDINAIPKLGESLLDKFPDLCKEWSKNNSKQPNEYCFYSHEKLEWKCNKCQKFWTSKICHRIYSNGCPFCSASKGENKIQEFLLKNNIQHKIEYRISNCKNKRPLPFDFAIFDKNNNLLGLIEYNGEQHYIQPTGRWKKFNLASQQNKDKIKKTFCNKEKIKLLIISYQNFDRIEQILENFLNEIGYTPK